MDMKCTVSIIVPIYNAGFSLHSCINSILNQSYRRIELLLVNDGSTDYSGMICDAYAKTDKRVRVIHQENGGPSQARNTGIHAATGDLIQFIDSDDYIDEDMTMKLVARMTTDVQLVICGYKSVYRNVANALNRSYLPPIEGHFSQEDFIQHIGELYKHIILPSPCNKLYRKEIIHDHAIRFEAGIDLGEDLLFNLEYIQFCSGINVIREQLYYYVSENNQSLSRKFTKDMLVNQQMLHQKVKDFLLANNCYDGKNKHFLQLIYANSIVNTLNNLFHEHSELTPEEVKQHISEIISDKQVRQHLAYFKDTIQARMIGQLIKYKASNGIYLFFTEKKTIKNRMYPLFKRK